jgi:hypothetical protein
MGEGEDGPVPNDLHQYMDNMCMLTCPTLKAGNTYLCSNKWSINPTKLAAFTAKTLIPAEAKKYAHKLVENEMPNGLKQYMETELFPCIQFKAAKGVSIETACHIMHEEGFRYTEHKKGVFYDGHERPDVVEY